MPPQESDMKPISNQSPDPRQATEDEEHDPDDQEQKYWRDWRHFTEDPPE
jgi:hypothetical protein